LRALICLKLKFGLSLHSGKLSMFSFISFKILFTVGAILFSGGCQLDFSVNFNFSLSLSYLLFRSLSPKKYSNLILRLKELTLSFMEFVFALHGVGINFKPRERTSVSYYALTIYMFFDGLLM
jgi:hypothetical protein